MASKRISTHSESSPAQAGHGQSDGRGAWKLVPTEAQIDAAMDAFYPGEDWREALGVALPSSRRDMRAALVAALAHPQTEGGRERVRHVKRDTEYEVIGEAEAQVAKGSFNVWPKGVDLMAEAAAAPGRMISDGCKLTFYRCEATSKTYCRFTDEFRDGRFETITAAPAPTAEPRIESVGDALPDDIRVPLHELQADAGYLFGRVAADSSCTTVMAASVKKKLNALEVAIRAALATLPDARPVGEDALREALVTAHEALHIARQAVANRVESYRPWVEKIPGRVNPWQATLDAVDAALASQTQEGTGQGTGDGRRPINEAPKDGSRLLCLTILGHGSSRHPEWNIGHFDDDLGGWFAEEGYDIHPSYFWDLPDWHPARLATPAPQANDGEAKS